MNIRYIIAMALVLVVGGFFVVRSITSSTPTAPIVQEQKEVFGEGAVVVGDLETSTTTSSSNIAPATTTQTSAPAVVTRTELAKHNTQADCWVAFKDVVYDITSWLPRHPGSAAAIAPYCGTVEAFTTAFSKKHGTSKEAFLPKVGTTEGTLVQ